MSTGGNSNSQIDLSVTYSYYRKQIAQEFELSTNPYRFVDQLNDR